MCGIFCVVSASFDDTQCKCKKLEEKIKPSLCRRGPNYYGQRKVDILLQPKQNDENLPVYGKISLSLSASVLHLRGNVVAKQPVEDEDGNILAWNGEIFSGLKINEGDSDTAVLLKHLNNGALTDHILGTFGVIEGPWSIVYYQTHQQCLWFGRDYFGRRSLLWHHPTSSSDFFALSSVGIRGSEANTFWDEVPADGLYCLDLKKIGRYFANGDLQDLSGAFIKYPWQRSVTEVTDSKLSLCGPNCPVENIFNKQLPTSCSPPLVSSKCFNTDNKTTPSKETPTDSFTQSTELVTDCNNKTTSSEISAQHDEMPEHGPNLEKAANLEKSVCLLTLNGSHQKWVEQFIDILTEAVRKRVYNLPRESLIGAQDSCEASSAIECSKRLKCDQKSKVGILFSGGLDSIVLAALADRCVPQEESIDLINVAFEQIINKNKYNNRKHRSLKEEDAPIKNFDVPDRVTGRNGVEELKVLNPERLWNFVEVNVTLEELQEARSQTITHLVFPHSTVLDDSIGCAIWFAARGTGTLICQQFLGPTDQCHHSPTYTSPTKVLLVGMGADEQLGGYARHRSRFNKEGWQGLLEEMEMEVQRISKRNLGRDDRCISDHGREGRYPYLDENVVSFLNSLPVWIKCDPRLDRGVGEKLLLRQLAKHIGLTSSSDLPKRAIQFGSKIAKLEKSSEKGSERCHRL